MIIKLKESKAIHDDSSVADLLQSILKAESPIDQDKEHFWTIGVDTRNTVKYIDLTSLGILNSSLVHPREVFRLAILKGVASLILGHNHPSGDTRPSQEDMHITKKLMDAGKLLGIAVLDHIIIGGMDHFSFRKEGLL